jgi:hypothetical protein
MEVLRRLMVGCLILIAIGVAAAAVQITSIDWDGGAGVIVVHLEPFPAWGAWRMYVNGVSVDMEGGAGNLVARPNAPLDQHPTALLVGTEPWLSPLPTGLMPCSGTLQFEIPGEGRTNAAEYDLGESMCAEAAAPPNASSTQGVGGTIAADTTWQGNIWVTSSVFVPAGVTLTIAPGTTIRFKHYRGYTDAGARLSMQVEGTLKAVGTASEPIWFTSDAADPMNGDWSMLRLVNASDQSEIRFAVLEFAQQGLNLWHSSPALSDLIVRWNNWEGIYLESYCEPTIERTRIYENGYNGIAMEQFNDVTIRDCYVADSGTNGIHVDASTATIEGCIVEGSAASGVSVDDHGTLSLRGCRIEGNGNGIGCGEGSNSLDVDAGTLLVGNRNDMASCSGVAVLRSPLWAQAPSEISFPLPDVRPYELGYTPGDRLMDRYLYVYPEVDDTRRVINKIGAGLGLTWSIAWDGESIWTATLWGDVFRLNPATGAVLAQWTYPGPQAWGMTWDGQHLWINDFAEKRVYEMTRSGSVVSSFVIPDPTGGAKGIAWDGQALCIMGWTSSVIYRVDRQGHLLETVVLKNGGGGLAWDGTAFWVPGGHGIERVSATGQSLGSIYACSEGTWDLTWDGQTLWATQRTNENWFDAKLFQIEILELLPD